MSGSSGGEPDFVPIAVGARSGAGGLWSGSDPNREPELYKLQQMMTDKTTTQVEPVIRPNNPAPTLLQARPVQPASRIRSVSLPRHFRVPNHHTRSSRNWAGAVVHANAGRRFTRVAARWRIPDLGKTIDPGSMVSIWIGLGGWLSWMDSMPHLGTEHGWDDAGNRIDRLWCQWWHGKQREAGWLSQIVDGLAISPGQEIVCHLALLDDGSVEFYFWNNETKKLAGVLAQGGKPVTGATAEWVVERPMRVEHAGARPARYGGPQARPGLRQVGLYRLPSIDCVVMSDCAARLGRRYNGYQRTVAQADAINMVDRHPATRPRPLRVEINQAELTIKPP